MGICPRGLSECHERIPCGLVGGNRLRHWVRPDRKFPRVGEATPSTRTDNFHPESQRPSRPHGSGCQRQTLVPCGAGKWHVLVGISTTRHLAPHHPPIPTPPT